MRKISSLQQVGFTIPLCHQRDLGALTSALFNLTRYLTGGMVSVALSLGLVLNLFSRGK